MIKDIISANENVTPNGREIALLRENFPSCFRADGSFDMTRFSEFLKDKIDVSQEGYELKFLGKNYARMLAALDTETVIVPDEIHNSQTDNVGSGNVYISGDNLDGLKHLLKSYAGAVKCIYIDPPYNTGTDGFVYKDKFEFTVQELMVKLSIEEDQAQRIFDLTKRGSASHSAWLMFMYPRLQLARDLMSKDGVIFISIDDNEHNNLKLLCDEIFGEENFMADFPRITKRGGKSSEIIAKNHDYLLMYSKTNSPNLYAIEHNDEAFKYSDKYFDERGYYKLNQTLDYDSLQYSKSLDYPLNIDGDIFYPGSSKEAYEERQSGIYDDTDWAWRWSKAKFDFGYANDFIVIKQGKKGKRIYTKTYQKATIEEADNGQYYIEYGDRTKSLSTLETTENVYSNDNATKDVAKTIGKKVFDHTKPLELISLLMRLCTREGDVVLDFFSGSASSAEAVMKLNCEEKIKRKYIMIQIPELCKENSSAYKAGYRSICDIGMSRISLAKEYYLSKYPNTTADLGFKHYTLREISRTTIDKIEKFDNSGFITDTTVYDEFGADTILTTWLVRDGYGFVNDCQIIDFAGYTAYWCENHVYLIHPNLTEEAIKALIEKYNSEGRFNPQNVIVFGYSFNFVEMENLKTNVRILRDSEKNLKINLDIRY